MTITKKTAAQYAQDLKASILSRNSAYDVEVGPIPDVMISPISNILELQNDKLISVNNKITLMYVDDLTDIDINEQVYNNGVIRSSGSKSTVELVFYAYNAPASDLVIAANTPVSTVSNDYSSTAICFYTLEAKTMSHADAETYYNALNRRYELRIASASTITGYATLVAPGRITRPLVSLAGWDGVTNDEASTGGADPESNVKLVDRYFMALRGVSPVTIDGISKLISLRASDVEDSLLVYGADVLNTRAATDAGAVDVYVIGSRLGSVTSSIQFTGFGQQHKLPLQPVNSVRAITGYSYGVDYTLVKDTSGYANSHLAADCLVWNNMANIPSIGSTISVLYTYDMLPHDLNTLFSSTELDTPSSNILFKLATQVNITLTASIKIKSGYSYSNVRIDVANAIISFINAFSLGNPVEQSDIQKEVRIFNGVDNFVISALYRVGAATSNSDITISKNEYARITAINLILSQV